MQGTGLRFAPSPLQKRRAEARLLFAAGRPLLEAAGGVGQHGVALAGLRGEIGARHPRAAVVARDVLEQPLELADVAVDRLLEIAVAAIALADLVEGLLPLHRIEPLGEHVAFAALVAVPKLAGRVVIDHAGDVDRERIERFERMPRRTLLAAALLVARGPGQQLAEPAVAAVAAIALGRRCGGAFRRPARGRGRPGGGRTR